jgi:two-component system, cell cycle response regulator DivK
MNPSQSSSVLLVEDNPDNRYLATLLLESEGYVVRPAVDGAAALEAVDREGFVFVLLDLQLPDIDGFEVARLLRKRFTASELPIVAVSAFAMRADRRKAFAAGCNGYLEKPIEAESFVAQVRNLVQTPAA